MASAPPDSELKQKHRKMWASGDYPKMVETFLLPLGPRLVEACGIKEGQEVLDVAAGTGNASIPAAERGAKVTASDLTPELFDAGRERAKEAGVELEWVEADAENLPFEDESFDVVISAIGVMFAPKPPPGAQPPPLWGSEDHVRELFGDRIDWNTMDRDVLDITAFEKAQDWGEHFKSLYGPTIAARANAEKDGRAEELDKAIHDFCEEWNLGTEDNARFEQEYLLSVGKRS